MNHLTNGSIQPLLKTHTRAFGGIFLVGFLVFLIVAVVGQLLTWNWRVWLPGAEAQKSLFSGVKSSVYTFMPYLN